MRSQKVKSGDIVKVDYTLTLENGAILSTTLEQDPLEFRVGDGEVIAGLENAVEGMERGETKNITIGSAEAFGERDEDLVLDMERSRFPQHLNPVPGQALEISGAESENIVVRVIEVSDSHVKIDANHPLAGQNFSMEVKLVEII